MLDNALENSHTTFCVFAFCIITSFNCQKLSNKSTSIAMTLIKIQNIHWVNIFTCGPIFPNCQPRFWCFYIHLHKFGTGPSRGKNKILYIYHQNFKALLQERHCCFCNTSTMTQKEMCAHTNICTLVKA